MVMVSTSKLLWRDSSLVRYLARMHIPRSSRLTLLTSVLLMFLSGLPLQEVPNAKKRYTKNQNWEAYSEYLRRTSILYPIPPAMYAPMPTFLKRTIFLELPLYVFKPSEEDEQERRKNTNGDVPRGSDAPLMQNGSN
jgi:hypothetical protein